MPDETEKVQSKRTGKTKRRIILSILIIILVLIGAGIYRINSILNQVERVDLDEDDLGIEIIDEPTTADPNPNPDVDSDSDVDPDPDVVLDTNTDTDPEPDPDPEPGPTRISNLSNENIVNIALFGVDSYNGEYQNTRSDTILIATVDFDHQTLKLTSIMRDLYVKIPDNGYNRVNSAYAFGGPALAIKTLNTNFDMNIRDFATVNFEAMEKIIDSIGGVEIDVKRSELAELNHLINHLNFLMGGNTRYLSSSGTQVLNGRQAVAYSRIRKVGQGDYERTERQRIVLEKVLNKVLEDGSITQAMRFADNLLPYVQTSLTHGEILSIGTRVFTSGTTSMIDSRIPLNGSVKNATINGAAVLVPTTLIDNVRYLHNFIYENDGYEPSERLQEISEALESK